MLDFKNYRSILCLHGDLPQKDFFNLALPIIAADGALNYLAKINIKPTIVIGDLDGADPILLKQQPSLYLPNQDTSDFQKCLSYLNDHGLLPTIITGINGGYLDHILNNINIFLTTDSILYAPPIIGFCLRPESNQQFSCELDTKMSLFGISNAVVSTKGLRWELHSQTLTFPGHNSCFNRTLKNEIEIIVHEGLILVLCYLNKMNDAASAI